MINIVVTPSIELKEFSSIDAEQLFNLIEKNRSYLREWLPWLDHSRCVADSIKFIEDATIKWAQKKSLILGIWTDNKIVGAISFNIIDLDNLLGKVGYWLSNEYQGKGIITQACSALVDYGFTELKLKTITISCAEGNSKSRAIASRLGFNFVGTENNKEWLYDHYVNHAVYSMNFDDWQKAKLKAFSETQKKLNVK